MKTLKKLTTLGVTAAMLATPGLAQADEHESCPPGDAGVAYYDSYGSQGLTPAIGLGVIAAVAVIAVAVNNSDRGHSHS